MDTVAIDLESPEFIFRANGSIIKFSGFLEVYQEGSDEESNDQEVRLPQINEGEAVQLLQLALKQHFTQPPPRYTEASLIKTLEEKGIGRPSTYAPTIDTILKRNYVRLEEKRFKPTELGQAVLELLTQCFAQVVDYDFTAEMEEKLDQIAAGHMDWVKVLAEFYEPFNHDLEKARENVGRVELAVEESDEKCEKCGRTMVYKYGRFGRFLACPGYPECKNAKPIRKTFGVKCPKCGAGEILERKSKKGRYFYGCNQYPNCDFVSWERPYKDPCPLCGAMTVVKGGKNQPKMIHCLKEGCSYQAEMNDKDQTE
jgi:DNA topoisomerase-1